jgi:hypothetical protein
MVAEEGQAGFSGLPCRYYCFLWANRHSCHQGRCQHRARRGSRAGPTRTLILRRCRRAKQSRRWREGSRLPQRARRQVCDRHRRPPRLPSRRRHRLPRGKILPAVPVLGRARPLHTRAHPLKPAHGACAFSWVAVQHLIWSDESPPVSKAPHFSGSRGARRLSARRSLPQFLQHGFTLLWGFNRLGTPSGKKLAQGSFT